MKKLTPWWKSAAACLFAAAAILTASCSRPASQSGDSMSVMIKGSDTMVHLVNAWAEAYMTAHPEASISVTGGGSGTGIAALINGTTDICMASRDMKTEEFDLAAKQGVEVIEHSVALDGLAMVVNPANPVENVTLEQLGSIFTGEYTDWQDLGLPAEKIVLLSRESSSGTFVFFREHVLHDKDYSNDALFLPATSTIVQQVAEDKGAIGYVGLGYAESAGDKLKVVPVKKDADSPAMLPNSETVKSGEYSIARPLHLYVQKSAPALAEEFVAYCLSPEGQAIATEAGYVRVD
ncbi:MAG: phosphate ABC transporter substrate-binding protein PstS family protein [Candidatus Hydrogenedens sp.]|nr:phosphate ABC transporter substrate-binding protein PstS family protein [Candidatus Hydrogenedens sp.]